MAAVLVAALVGCDEDKRRAPVTTAAAPPTSVGALGSLQPADGVIAISAMPGDRLKQFDAAVAVNKPAPADGVLGVMASYDARLAQCEAIETKREITAEKHRLEREAATARVEAAAAQLSQAEAKLAEVTSQAKRLSYLREAAAIAESDFAELERLADEDPELITRSQLRRKANQVDRATKDFEIAQETHRAALTAAKQAVTAASKSLDSAERSRATLDAIDPVRVVDEELRLARESLIQSILLIDPEADRESLDPTNPPLDPTTGSEPGRHTVLRVYLDKGEAVRQTPVLELGDLSRMVCVAEVSVVDAKHVTTGQAAKITSRSFGGEYLGKALSGVVERVAPVVGAPGLLNANPLAPVDRRVVEVRIAIDARDSAEAARWVGMQVEVRIDLEDADAKTEAKANAEPKAKADDKQPTT